MSKKTFGLKKIGLTIAFSILGVFRFFFRPIITLGSTSYYNNYYEDRWGDFNDQYRRAMEEIDVDACVDRGNTEQYCRSSVGVAA
jgi:hypothetical protein